MAKWLASIIAASFLGACSLSAHTGQAEETTAPEQTKNCFERGVQAYFQQHYTEAATAFTQASAAGHREAAAYIGLMYLNGYGVAKNAQRAAAEFTKSALKGDVVGQYWLAYCHEQGIGVVQNKDEALKWYQAAAAQKGSMAAAAMTALGRIAEADNRSEAAAWYKKAVAEGDEAAKEALQHLEENNTTGF